MQHFQNGDVGNHAQICAISTAFDYDASETCCASKFVPSRADEGFCDDAAPVPEDIQNIIRSMWLCDAPDEAPNDAPNEGDNKGSPAAPREISPGEASSIIEALAAPPAPAKPGKRGNNGGTTTKVSIFTFQMRSVERRSAAS